MRQHLQGLVLGALLVLPGLKLPGSVSGKGDRLGPRPLEQQRGQGLGLDLLRGLEQATTALVAQLVQPQGADQGQGVVRLQEGELQELGRDVVFLQGRACPTDEVQRRGGSIRGASTAINLRFSI